MQRVVLHVSSLVFVWSLLTVPATAQTVGVVAGASVDPDQFYFGSHVQTAPLVQELRFRPSLEIGLGSDVAIVGANFEFVYMLPIEGSNGWNLYGGGGPALNIIDTERDTSAEGGFNLLVGASHDNGLFGEIKVGFLDSPDFKVGVGYSFRW